MRKYRLWWNGWNSRWAPCLNLVEEWFVCVIRTVRKFSGLGWWRRCSSWLSALAVCTAPDFNSWQHYYKQRTFNMIHKLIKYEIIYRHFWSNFDRASSLICRNKKPTRCNRWFLLQILLLAQHVSVTIMSIIRSSRVLYRRLLPVVFGALVFKLSLWCEHQIRQAASTCIILSSSWWWA